MVSCLNKNFDDFVADCLLENKKVKAFEGGRLTHFVDQCQVSSDSEIFNLVTGLKLNFICKKG